MHHKSNKKKAALKNDEQEVSIAQSEYNGPVPSPEDLARYNEMIPNGAERFMVMAEKEQMHRHQSNRTIIEEDRKRSIREYRSRIIGQIFGFLSLVGLISLCAYAFSIGNAEEAQKIATWSLIGVVGLFITGKYFIGRQKDTGKE